MIFSSQLIGRIAISCICNKVKVLTQYHLIQILPIFNAPLHYLTHLCTAFPQDSTQY